MDTTLLEVIRNYSKVKVLVIGEAMLDSYLGGFSERLCREAPVPVVSVTDRDYVPGGAANTAVNIRSLGAEVEFLSVLGDDPEGSLLQSALEERRVSTGQIIVSPGRRTLAKQRVLSGAQMLVRFDQGDTDPPEPAVEKEMIRRIEKALPGVDAVIISDYDYGILTPKIIRALARFQSRHPRLFVVDSKRLEIYREIKPTAVKPNYNEATQLLGLQSCKNLDDRVEQMTKHGRKILDLTRAQIAALTMDQHGALIFERGDGPPYRTYAKSEPNSRAAGAGDTYVSALTLSLAAGAHVENAAELASAAASIVVSKEGTAACQAEELHAHFSTSEKFVTDVFQLAASLAVYRQENRRIVFTNGCFDILHRGHIAYLNRAKALGDILIVGLNSDDSVRRLKGPERPINPLEDRGQILAALSCVDHIVPFDGNTPHELIRVIKPDIFVKGGDYSRETLPEAGLVEKLGGEVKILPYLDDHSTSSIIERIRKIYAGDASG